MRSAREYFSFNQVVHLVLFWEALAYDIDHYCITIIVAHLQPDVPSVSLDELLKINSFPFLSFLKQISLRCGPLKYSYEVNKPLILCVDNCIFKTLWSHFIISPDLRYPFYFNIILIPFSFSHPLNKYFLNVNSVPRTRY